MRFFCLLLTFAVFGATASFQAAGASAGNDSKETEKAKPLTVVEPVGEVASTIVNFELPPKKQACKLVSADNVEELVNLLRNEAKAI